MVNSKHTSPWIANNPGMKSLRIKSCMNGKISSLIKASSLYLRSGDKGTKDCLFGNFPKITYIHILNYRKNFRKLP